VSAEEYRLRGAVVRKRQKEIGLRFSDLALDAKVTPQVLLAAIRDQRTITPGLLRRLAARLGVSPGELIDDRGRT
jgi:transcriptional regulator with XRE-family HTH domain